MFNSFYKNSTMSEWGVEKSWKMCQTSNLKIGSGGGLA